MNNKNNSMKVRFNNKNLLPLQNKKCVLLVSVGQKYHEEEWLCSTVELINQSNFSMCTIAVADTLQRHNFQDKSSEESYRLSLLLGDEWLKRNQETIKSLIPEVDILRWDTALNEPDYIALKQKITTAYLENEVYADAINSTITVFVERVKKRNPDADLDAVFKNCLKYLIEECPIIMPLWASQGYDFIIYPKVMTSAMAMTRELFVKPFYQDKASWLSLDFKRVVVPTSNNHQDVSLDNYLNSKISEMN